MSGLYIPGPQRRGTGGTLGVVLNDHRDRGHPPTYRILNGIEVKAMPWIFGTKKRTPHEEFWNWFVSRS
jgi:hypothetical protein